MKTYKVKSDNIPAECDYLTKGKIYQAHPTNRLGVYFIICDDGEGCNIRIPESCSHLDYRSSWEIVDED